jgi:hypothetical protein
MILREFGGSRGVRRRRPEWSFGAFSYNNLKKNPASKPIGFEAGSVLEYVLWRRD